MWLREYPRLLFKERRLVWSKHELKDKAIEGMGIGKQILVSLYSFGEIEDAQVIPESAVVDVLMFTGIEADLKKLGILSNDKSYLIFDGEEYYLILEREANLKDLDKIEQEYVSFGVKLNKDPLRMVILPNTFNQKTKIKCEIVWKK